MLFFTYGNRTKNAITTGPRYYRKETDCDNKCFESKVVKVLDCNACKPKRTANTNLQSNYYASSTSYLRSRSKLYEQANTARKHNSETNSITKDGCDERYNCGVYKRNNSSFQTNGAVSSGAKIMRTKHQNIVNAYETNSLRPRYHGDSTMNILHKPQKPVCHRKTGTKTSC